MARSMSEGVPKAGHLPGAHEFVLENAAAIGRSACSAGPGQLQQPSATAGADPDKLIVTYCRTGMQSSFTYFVAKYLGYRAAMYDGSVYEWVNRAGYDLVQSDSSLLKTEFSR